MPKVKKVVAKRVRVSMNESELILLLWACRTKWGDDTYLDVRTRTVKALISIGVDITSEHFRETILKLELD